MSAAHFTSARRGVLRHSRWDALPVGLALLHGALLVALPAAPVVALGLWWNSNTVAHYFLHRPFFRRRALNVAFALYLSVLLGVPQTLWRQRHLAHHAGRPWRLRPSRQLCVESALVLALWATLLALVPAFFLTAYLPGYVAGLGLCWLHGHYEHARGTTSHYGTLYNFLFLNDGYHVEHHAHPGAHWTRLPGHAAPATRLSAWPAVLRWLETPWLELLERRVLRSPRLQRFLLDRHERAFAALLPHLPKVRSAAIVGGGLWPRTLLVLRRLLPDARLVVIDRSAENLAAARPFFPAGVEIINDFYDPVRMNDFDLVVIPLSLLGDREALYRDPPAPTLLVHDWIWRRRGQGVVVSWLLLKRLNLVKPCAR
ncbi:MAG TPA: fatty acid desaturase [Gemmataceae bacterium]|nr:fatty acid desaturase [Gemmataceae bacterium]